MNRRLFRSRTDSVIGGVAGGVAEYLDVDPSIVRIVWAVLAIVTGGIFFVLYIVMWIVVPEGAPGPVAPYQPGPGAIPGWTPPASQAPAPPATPLTTTEAGEPADTDPVTGQPADAAAPAPGTEPTTEQPAWTAAPAAGYAPEHRRGSGAAMIFGALLILLGAWFLLDEYIPALNSDLLWPIALVVIGVALLVIAMRRSSDG